MSSPVFQFLVIGISRRTVCLSVFCNAVHCGSQGQCTGVNIFTSVFLAGKFLFAHSGTLL